MVEYEYGGEKNETLKKSHNISFEEIIVHIKTSRKLITISHPNKGKYAHQKIILVEIQGYIWVIPNVMHGKKIFLKTAFPSRKYTKKYVTERKK